jgi:hypothetical protein
VQNAKIQDPFDVEILLEIVVGETPRKPGNKIFNFCRCDTHQSNWQSSHQHFLYVVTATDNESRTKSCTAATSEEGDVVCYCRGGTLSLPL